MLGRTHAALDGVKAGILRFLESCPQARDLLTFEGPCSCRRAETHGLPRWSSARDRFMDGLRFSAWPAPAGPARHRSRTPSQKPSVERR